MVPAISQDNVTLRVESGAILVLRLYDVAFAIDLPRVEVLAAAPVSRLRLRRAEPKAISFGTAPVELSLGEIVLPGSQPRGEAIARLYEFGAVAISLRVPVQDLGWEDYVDLVNATYRWAASATGAQFFADTLARVQRQIAPALTRPSPEHIEEDYLLSIVHRFNREVNADEFGDDIDLVPLLSGERQLAASERAELLRHRFSYYPNDLVVLTWDRAFVIEPSGDMDVADVLEVANAQLLELRYYDELLDAELPVMYGRVESARQRLRGLGRRRYAALARQLHTLVAEVTEITERIDNALKVTEDVYLARIYGAALELFRTGTWGAAVDHKLAIIRDTYSALYDDAATARAELLELTIVLLIVFEVILAFVI
ncbi:MAG TPA: hypothetical protein VGC44_08245 [Longimicrobiales bacterium]